MQKIHTTSDLLLRFFPHRAAKPLVYTAFVALVVFFVVYLTRINSTPVQKLTIFVLAAFAMWQFIQQKSIDILALLLTYLGMFILYSLYRLESLPISGLMILSAILVIMLTAWQMHGQFAKAVLWRHAYISGLLAAQITAFFAYWIIYDDVLGKAILTTLMFYVIWGLLECDAQGELKWSAIRGYLSLALLLTVVVLVTMKPSLGGALH